jgi:hypothetical protein
VFAEGKGAGAPYVPQVEAAIVKMESPEPPAPAPATTVAAGSVPPTAMTVPPSAMADEPSVRAMIRDATPPDGVRAVGPFIEIDLRSLSSGSRARKRLAMAAVAAVAVAAMAAVTAGLKGKADQSSGPPRPPPTALAAEPPPATEVAEAPPPTVAKETPAPSVAKAAPPKAPTGLGRLVIAGEAKSRAVYMDGKLMLGSGARSFNVRCGPHTLAVGNKADAREIEIPCNGETKITR